MIKGILLIVVILAVLFDLRTYRIPNRLLLCGLIATEVSTLIAGGWRQLGISVLGIVLPILLLFLLYQLRVLGAGDIKLFAVIGGGIGPGVWKVILYSFIVGGVLALIQMVYHHNLVSRIHYFWQYIQGFFYRGQIVPYSSGFEKGERRNVLHFSIPILIGYIFWILKGWV